MAYLRFGRKTGRFIGRITPTLRGGIPSVLLLAVFAASRASAQTSSQVSCAVNTGVPPVVRAEGYAELVGDIVMQCTGGTRSPAGAAIQRLNVQVFLNTTITSRVLQDPWSEALLLLDEPSPAQQFTCTAADGVCAGTSTGTGVVDYRGVGNVHQGRFSAPNSIVWVGIPFDPPGTTERIIRITNLRARVTEIGSSSTLVPTQVMALVSVSSSQNVTVTNPQAAVAFIQNGLVSGLRDYTNAAESAPSTMLPACVARETTPYAVLQFREGAQSFFRRRTQTAFSSSDVSPPPAAQDSPGVWYNTETGLYNPSLTGPAEHGPLGTAGLATSGTRLKATFGNIPAGARVFVDAVNIANSATHTARLVQSESGPFVPAAAGATGLAELPIVSGAATAIWEVLGDEPTATNSYDFRMYVSYTPSSAPLVASPATVVQTLAPIGPSGASSPLPDTRPIFLAAGTERGLFHFSPCTLTITTASPLPPASVGVPYSQALQASGGNQQFTGWRVVTGALPAGLTLNPATGVISGTPSTPGPTTFTVEVRNNVGEGGGKTFTLAVGTIETPIFRITSGQLPTARVGEPYSSVFTAAGGILPLRNWRIVNGTAAGLTLNPTTGVLSGIPTTSGAFRFEVQVEDSRSLPAVARQVFDLFVAPAFAITSANVLPAASVGTTYSFRFTAEGGTPPYRNWRFASGAIPGLAIDPSTGVLSGTPPTSGTFRFDVQVEDSRTPPATARKTLELTVESALSITTQSLPPATAGSTYSHTLTAAGGSGALVNWTITSGSLPQGLTLNAASGSISGTVPAATTSTLAPFAVQVTDSRGAVATRLFSLQVLAASVSSHLIAPGELLFEVAPEEGITESVITVTNRGRGEIPVTARVRAASEATWLTVSSAPGSTTATVPVSIVARANPAGLAPGTYFAQIAVDAGPTTTSIPVILTIRLTPQPTVVLSQGALSFSAVSGRNAPLEDFFSVLNSGRGLMNWTASAETLSGGSTWLSISPSAGTTDADNPSAPAVAVRVHASGLAPGFYSGQVRVNAPDSTNRIQVMTVVLRVLPAQSPVDLLVLPTGLIFIAPGVETTPAEQQVTITNPGGVARAVTVATVMAEAGPSWLSATASAGQIEPESQIRIVARAEPRGLAPGVHRGAVTLRFSDNTQSSVDVVLVVLGRSTGTAARAAVSTCVPQQVIPVFTTLSSLSGFRVTTNQSEEVRVRSVQIGADCAEFMTAGKMWIDATDGAKEYGFAEREGVWAANWTPLATGALELTSTVITTNGISGTVKVTAEAARDPNLVLPIPQTITNSASYVLGQPVSPGSWMTIKGADLADVDGAVNNTAPFPEQLGGTVVRVGDRPVPLHYVSPRQINALLPFDMPTNTTVPLQVRRRNAPSEVRQVFVAEPQPAIFSADGTGVGQGAIQIANTPTLAARRPVGTPAKRGDTISIFAVGLGAVTNPIPAGEVAPLSPLSFTITPVTVEIGGVAVTPLFSGLAPQLAGVYQVNATIPNGAPVGDAVSVVLVQRGSRTPAVTIAIE